MIKNFFYEKKTKVYFGLAMSANHKLDKIRDMGDLANFSFFGAAILFYAN